MADDKGTKLEARGPMPSSETTTGKRTRRGENLEERRRLLDQEVIRRAHDVLDRYDPPDYDYVELAILRIDLEYQRRRSPGKVKALRGDWSPWACQPMAVSVRKNGDHYLVDGQHRAATLESLDIKFWPALLYKGLSAQDEARMWMAVNSGQTKPNTGAQFVGLLASGDHEAQQINALVVGAGYRINTLRGRHRTSGIYIDAIAAVIRIFREARGPGLARVLRVVSTAWPDPDETQRTSRLILLGLHNFLAGACEGTVDDKLLARVVGSYTPGVWIAKTRGVTSGEHPSAILAARIRAAYNKAVKAGHRV